MPHRLRLARTLGAAATTAVLVAGPFAVPATAEPTEVKGFEQKACELMAPTGESDEKLNANSWQVDRLAPEKAWEYATGKGITVAVIDTGITVGESDYFDEEVESYNFADPEPDKDGFDCQHGTGVAGLIAGRKPEDSPRTFTGVAPDAEIISMRALKHGQTTDDSGQERERELLAPTINSILMAIELDVDIINISQAGDHTPAYAAAVKQAQDAGILIVAAAGNNPGAGPSYPAAYPGVVAVGSTDRNDRPSEFSQSDEEMAVSVAAPGSEILRLEPSGDRGQAFFTDRGTSFAAPQVTGVAALIMERYPELTAAEVKRRLETTADIPGGRSVPDPILGYGIVNPHRAMTDVMALEDPGPGDPGEKESRPPLQHPFEKDRKDTATLVALGIGGGSILIVLVSLVISSSLPAGRDRKWKSAD